MGSTGDACPRCGAFLAPGAAWCPYCKLLREGTQRGEMTDRQSRRVTRLPGVASATAMVSGVVCVAGPLLIMGKERDPSFNEGLLAVLAAAAAFWVRSAWVWVRRGGVRPLNGLAAIVVLLPLLWQVSVFVPTLSYRSSARDVAADVKPACVSGSAVAQAARYGGTNHPLVAVDLHIAGVAGPWTNLAMGQDWTPVTSEVQLVACLGPKVDIEGGAFCGPYGYLGMLPLLLESREVWIVEASTGRLVARRTFDAGGACPEKVYYYMSDLPTHVHDWLDEDDDAVIGDYIRSWITGPVQHTLASSD